MTKEDIMDLFKEDTTDTPATGAYFDGKFIEYVDMPAVIELLLKSDD